MKPYRQSLPADEPTRRWPPSAAVSYSTNIEDYYLTPSDLGYGSIVKFDHDFVGREALEKMVGEARRKKVTLLWDGEDFARAASAPFVGKRGRSAKVHRSSPG